MAQFTVRLDGVIEATCDNLAAALHKADTWAKRYREVYTVHRDDRLVAIAKAHPHGGGVNAPKPDRTQSLLAIGCTDAVY